MAIEAAGPPRWDTGHRLRLPIHLGLELLGRSFDVRLENSRTDRAFLLAIARPEWRQRLLRWEEREWLRFVHGGGFPQLLDDYVAFLRQNRGNPRSFLRRRRLWFVFDSDRLRPGAAPARGPRRLAKRCDDTGVGAWCLRRRFIESYLPPHEVDQWAREHAPPRRLDAYRRLDHERQRFVNLKRGILRDLDRPRLDGADRAYWEAVPQQALEWFDGGFGDKLRDVFTEAIRPDQNLPLRFDRDARDEADRELARLIEAL